MVDIKDPPGFKFCYTTIQPPGSIQVSLQYTINKFYFLYYSQSSLSPQHITINPKIICRNID